MAKVNTFQMNSPSVSVSVCVCVCISRCVKFMRSCVSVRSSANCAQKCAHLYDSTWLLCDSSIRIHSFIGSHLAVFLFQLYGATEIYWFVWSFISPRQQPKNHVRLIRICAMAGTHTLTTYHIFSTASIV